MIKYKYMENYFKNENNSAIRMKVELQKKINFAKEHALSQEEYEQGMKNKFELRDIENKQDLTTDEIKYLVSLQHKINEATVEAENLFEFRHAMEILGFKHETIIYALSHENAHGNKAEQLGATHIGYRFILVNTPEGLGVQPQTSIYIPDELDEKVKNNTLVQIIKAPEEYGGEMSEGDLRDLDYLNSNK